MNKTILMGRLTKNPEVKCLQDENSTAMAHMETPMFQQFWQH